MERPCSLRVMTYNVHRCVGTDGVLAPARVAAVIAEAQPDVVALQELDVGRARTDYGDQPALIAEHLRMEYHFAPAITVEDERYGNALLSRLPLKLVRAGALPAFTHRETEARGAMWAAVECEGRTVQVLNTHLSLRPGERRLQAEALAGPAWLGDPDCTAPRIVCGDFNAWPGSAAYRCLCQRLHDAQQRPGAWPRYTFPSRLPVLRLDHVLHSPDVTVLGVRVPRTRLARVASDHLPVVVEVALP